MQKKNLNLTKNHIKIKISTTDWVLDRSRDFFERQSKWTGIAVAFLMGMFVNIFSDPNVNNLRELLNRMFNVHIRSLNVLSWFAAIIILLLTLGRFLLKMYFRKHSYAVKLAEIYHEKVDSSIQPFSRGRIAWGLGLTLQSCPDLRRGWSIEKIQIQYDPTKYVFPRGLDKSYRDYLEKKFPTKYADDKIRLMLIEDPRAFSDAPTLVLRVQETKWSQVRFYQDSIVRDLNERVRYIENVLKTRRINFPNSLCLHLVIVTSDGYLLLTQSSPKVEYYPNLWACSIGEQLNLSDLEGSEKKFALNWVERALQEELGILRDDEYFSSDNIRVMAVILEGDTVNFAIVTLIFLNCNREELDSIIDKRPRTDYEFQKWEFISWDNIPNQLLDPKPTRIYHPSTGIRMFYTGLFKFGAPGLNRRLGWLKSNPARVIKNKISS